MAGTIGTYYFDGTSFANATMLYTDATLSTVAPNGYYQQNDIVRQLVGGPGNPVLLQPQACVSCSVPCGSGVSGTGGTGKYTLSMNLGNSIGAVKVTFNPQSVPDKCSWTYDGTTRSEYSSSSEGYLQGVIGTISTAASCTLSMDNANGSNNQTVTGASYVYDAGSNSFVNQGVPVTLGPYSNQASGGVDFTTTAPGNCIMVVPKPNATPETVDFVIEGPCAGTAWNISVDCPAALTSFQGSAGATSGSLACAQDATTNTYYNMPVAGTAGNPAATDWIFTDANGVNKAADNYYKISGSRHMHVQNGVCVGISPCVSSYLSSTVGVFNDVCGGATPAPPSQTYYHTGSGSLPVVGDFAYSNPQGTAQLPDGYYYLGGTSPNRYYIRITGGAGEVTTQSTC